MIRTNVLAIRVALVACSIATFRFVAAGERSNPGRPGAGGASPTRARPRRTWPDATNPQAPPTPQAQAPIDLTGWWVSVVTEDWRWRMVTPPKGDYASVPINAEGRRGRLIPGIRPRTSATATRAEAYGVGGIMRVPGRLHITWQDEDTLKIETDAGTQTRLLRFAPPDESSADVALGLRAAAAPRSRR